MLCKCNPPPSPTTHTPRYLVSTDGWGVSAKFEKSLLLGSTVLKAASPLFAYFYSALVPWVHFAPFYTHGPSDIIETIATLRADDGLARRIAANGQKFANRHLNRAARLCYYREVITQMARLFRWAAGSPGVLGGTRGAGGAPGSAALHSRQARLTGPGVRPVRTRTCWPTRLDDASGPGAGTSPAVRDARCVCLPLRSCCTWGTSTAMRCTSWREGWWRSCAGAGGDAAACPAAVPLLAPWR
jgi:hypothetical protein